MIRRILKQIVDARIVTVMWTTVLHETGFQIRTSDALVRKSPFYDPNMLLLLLSSRTSQTPMTIYEVWHQKCLLEI